MGGAPKKLPGLVFFSFPLGLFIGPLLDVEMAGEREVGLACILFILGIA